MKDNRRRCVFSCVVRFAVVGDVPGRAERVRSATCLTGIAVLYVGFLRHYPIWAPK